MKKGNLTLDIDIRDISTGKRVNKKKMESILAIFSNDRLRVAQAEQIIKNLIYDSVRDYQLRVDRFKKLIKEYAKEP